MRRLCAMRNPAALLAALALPFSLNAVSPPASQAASTKEVGNQVGGSSRLRAFTGSSSLSSSLPSNARSHARKRPAGSIRRRIWRPAQSRHRRHPDRRCRLPVRIRAGRTGIRRTGMAADRPNPQSRPEVPGSKRPLQLPRAGQGRRQAVRSGAERPPRRRQRASGHQADTAEHRGTRDDHAGSQITQASSAQTATGLTFEWEPTGSRPGNAAWQKIGSPIPVEPKGSFLRRRPSTPPVSLTGSTAFASFPNMKKKLPATWPTIPQRGVLVDNTPTHRAVDQPGDNAHRTPRDLCAGGRPGAGGRRAELGDIDRTLPDAR